MIVPLVPESLGGGWDWPPGLNATGLHSLCKETGVKLSLVQGDRGEAIACARKQGNPSFAMQDNVSSQSNAPYYGLIEKLRL